MERQYEVIRPGKKHKNPVATIRAVGAIYLIIAVVAITWFIKTLYAGNTIIALLVFSPIISLLIWGEKKRQNAMIRHGMMKKPEPVANASDKYASSEAWENVSVKDMFTDPEWSIISGNPYHHDHQN